MFILENYWRSTENQRKFFIEFASQKGFDPLIPENWDNITKEDISKQVRRRLLGCSIILLLQGGAFVSTYYDNFQQALLELLPNIGLCFYFDKLYIEFYLYRIIQTKEASCEYYSVTLIDNEQISFIRELLEEY